MAGSTARYFWRILRPFRHTEGVSGWLDIIPYGGVAIWLIAGVLIQLPLPWLVTTGLVGLVILLFVTGLGLQVELDTRTDEVTAAIKILDGKKYRIGSTDVTLTKILLLLRNKFLVGLAAPYLGVELRRAMGFGSPEMSSITVPEEDIIADLHSVELVESERIDPAPGAGSSIRGSLHDLPYHRYKLNSLGTKVLEQLEPTAE